MYRRSLIVYTFVHFAVDFACFFVLFSIVYKGIDNLQYLTFWFLIYNIIAFGLQFVIGYLWDVKRNFHAGLIGIIITIVGLSFARQIYVSVLVIALGNAFFHVGGGIDSLVNAKGKMSRSGVFVSSGTWGVVLGALAGRAEISILYPIGFLAVSGVLVYMFAGSAINNKKSSFAVAAKGFPIGAAVALIFLSVAVRAHTGFSVSFPWKVSTYLILLGAAASFLGKLFGGFTADKLGARLTGVGALLLSIPLLAFYNQSIILSLLGIMLFNMTMPVTLCVLAEYLEGHEGLAFGLTTLALLAGTFVTYVYVLDNHIAKYVIIISIIISALFIWLTTAAKSKRIKYKARR